jgi:hypothetical protein
MNDEQPTQRHWWLPSPVACVFLAITAVAAVFAGNYMLNLDGELARHLTHGRYMVESGHLMRDYPFSYTTPGRPFLAMEYGTQLLFYSLYSLGGLVAVASATIVLLAASHALQMRVMLRRGVDPVLGFAAVAVAAAMGAMFWQARPHMISLLMVAILLQFLEGTLPKRPWWALALFAVWANFHPGWVYGLILIGIYGVGAVLEPYWRGDRTIEWRSRTSRLAQAFVAGCVGTLLTPHGITLHRHVAKFFSLTYQFDNIGEFLSPNFHDPSFRPLLLGILLIIAAVAMSGRRLAVAHILILVTHVQQTLQANRYASLLGLTGMTVVAIHLAPEWKAFVTRTAPAFSALEERWRNARSPLAWAAAALILLGLTATHGRVAGRQVIPDRFAVGRFPVQVVDRAMRAGRTGRVYAETISWSDYVIFAWPHQTIFIDGSGDFFGNDLLRESHQIRGARPGYDVPLSQRNVELVMASARGPLAQALLARPDWKVLDCDQVVVLFGSSGTPEPVSALGQPTSRCVKSVDASGDQ